VTRWRLNGDAGWERGDVLSISPIHQGDDRRGVRYYLDKVANSRDDYYVGRGEAPGVWLAHGAAALELSGTVDADDYLAVMDGRSPLDNRRLVDRQGERRVCGWSLTFSAPKSLSLLWAFGGHRVADAVRNAHDQAVSETVTFLEQEVARARRGHGGAILHDVDGLIGAAFRHRSSRAGDPQLHTHVIVANLVRSTQDGRWSGLDSRGLYDLVAAGSAVYQSALRATLTPLGLRWAVRSYGLGEVADIDPRLLRAFSTQRRRIESEMARRGASSPAAAQIAAYRVRPPRDTALAAADDDGLRAHWADELTKVRLGRRAAGRRDVTRALSRDKAGPTTESGERAVIAVLAGANTPPNKQRRPRALLTERASTLTRAQIIRAVATAMDRQPAQLRQAVERLLARPEVVPLLAGPGMGGRAERRRYSTRGLLALEHRLLESAVRRQAEGCERVSPSQLATVIAGHPDLGNDQRVVLRQLLCRGNGIEVVVGPAGTGKTSLLAAGRDAWERAGYRVHGAALAALAAAQLQAGSGITATTVHQLLDELSRAESHGLTNKDIVVVDEAAMVGSRTLALLAQLAEQAGAKLVLAGDHHQLPEIDAGGGFRMLAEALDASHLNENRRQVARWERAALAELRAGSVPAALASYAEHGRIWHADPTDIAREAIIERWWQLRNDGVGRSDLLLIAATKHAVRLLGQAAQDRLRNAGQLGRRVAETEHGSLHIGDRVLATRNDRRLGVRNGQRGTILNGNPQGDLVVVFDDDDGETRLPDWYVASHVHQGYAVTAHRAQGTTIDRALALVDDTWYRELGYSALSRARHGTELYLTDVEVPDPMDHHPIPPPPEPLTVLAQQFGRSRAEQAAVSALPELPDLGDPAAARAAWDELDALTARLTNHQLSSPEPKDAPTRSETPPSVQQPGEDQTQLRTLEARLHYRASLLGVAAHYQRPDWATKVLGPLPTGRAGEAAWLTAAGALAAYLERWGGVDDAPRASVYADARHRHANRVAVALEQLRRSTNSTAMTSVGSWPELDHPVLTERPAGEAALRNIT
jgi:conjugative relaxase-like TrwC/TraI family protein